MPTLRDVVLAASAALLALLAAPAGAQSQSRVSAQTPAAGELVVFAAASLQNAFTDIGRLHAAAGGAPLRFSFASSSVLARQIEQGAPAAVFASADEQWMDYLQRRQLVATGSRKSLLVNRLVLVVPADNAASVAIGPGFDFAALLGKDGRWVTGDPSNVPVGRYAQEALTRLGAWTAAKPRLVRAENVRVALAFVERGEAAAGIVYETDAAVSKKVRIAGVFPPGSHAPVSYPVAAMAKHDRPAARAFLHFLDSEQAREVFRKYGFTVR
jgi:molybdate transport system substrate-binding protein